MNVRHLINVSDLTPREVIGVFDESAVMKSRLRRGIIENCLAGKTLALVFEKASNRTRVSFEVGMTQLGGHSIYLASDCIRLGERETIPDAARTLSGYVDGVVVRTYAHSTVTEFAKYSSVPVINGLSDYSHPCQALADLFTIREKLGRLAGVKLAFVGDGNNVARSLASACYRLGLHFAIASPKGYELEDEFVSKAHDLVPEDAGSVTRHCDPYEAVKDADVVYTDVWASMGQEAEARQRRTDFAGYQVDGKLLAAAKKGALVMHCLPAHRGEEITDEVIEGPQSIVFEQAESRLHVQKGLLKLLMASPEA